ncbi:putative receptor protein kinase ZmPK1 [Hordeum vulgare]|nr:putative receptor protein kinase ZmPK1 [Hordeum vulgare]
MAPRMTLAVGGVAPAPAVKPRAPLSKLPNVAVAKKGKIYGKKNKAADGSSRRPKTRLVGRSKDAAATEAPASSLAAPAADAHMVVYGMSTSFNDETYMSTMGVGSNNSHWSQTNEVHFDDHMFEVDGDGEGIIGASKGRAGNYTMDEDVLLCNTWLQVSRDATVGGDQSRYAYWIRTKEHFDLHNRSGIDRSERSLRSPWSTINRDCQRWAVALKAFDTLNPSGTNDRDRLTIAQNSFQGEKKKTKKGKNKKGMSFTLPHCYDALKDDEKWKPHEGVNEESNKRKRTIDFDDD